VLIDLQAIDHQLITFFLELNISKSKSWRIRK